MTAYVQTLTDFISGNPHLAVVIVFFVAASEAIAVVGALVPGTAILIGISAVVGLGHLPLWPILIAATFGAVVGDGLSYWFGHRYKNALPACGRFPAGPISWSTAKRFSPVTEA